MENERNRVCPVDLARNPSSQTKTVVLDPEQGPIVIEVNDRIGRKVQMIQNNL
jgi:hypothetical protein